MELTITIKPPELTALQQRAANKGIDIKEEVASIIGQELHTDAVLAPVREDFANSGMTDDDIARLIKSERRAMWEEKHGQKN